MRDGEDATCVKDKCNHVREKCNMRGENATRMRGNAACVRENATCVKVREGNNACDLHVDVAMHPILSHTRTWT